MLVETVLFPTLALFLLAGVGALSISSEELSNEDTESLTDVATWPPLCYEGTQQSPINIVSKLASQDQKKVGLSIQSFGAKKFHMQNNGHTLSVRFNPCETGSCINSPFFPGLASYTFADLHFHWGSNDKMGSEHLVDGKRYAMEMHAVHYKSKYESVEEALDSGDPDALAVVAILFEASKSVKPHPSLALIIKHLPQVRNLSSEDWFKVEQKLDLFPLFSKNNKVFNYHGSLTTPPCREQVEWFVFKKPVLVSTQDVAAFRTSLRDGSGGILQKNWRPTQTLGKRRLAIVELN